MYYYRRSEGYHNKGGRVSRKQIALEVEQLRAYLKKPRTLKQIGEHTGLGDKTILRRFELLGDVWRVVPQQERTARYVHIKGWK